MRWSLKVVSVDLHNCERRLLQDLWVKSASRGLLVVVLRLIFHMVLNAQRSWQLSLAGALNRLALAGKKGGSDLYSFLLIESIRSQVGLQVLSQRFAPSFSRFL